MHSVQTAGDRRTAAAWALTGKAREPDNHALGLYQCVSSTSQEVRQGGARHAVTLVTLKSHQGSLVRQEEQSRLRHLGFAITLKQQFSKCGPGTCSNRIALEHARDANSKASKTPDCAIRSSGSGATCCFHKSSP